MKNVPSKQHPSNVNALYSVVLRITDFKAIAKKDMQIPSVSHTHLTASERSNSRTRESYGSRSGPSDMEQEPFSISYAEEASPVETDAEHPVMNNDERMDESDAPVHNDEDHEMSLPFEPEENDEEVVPSNVSASDDDDERMDQSDSTHLSQLQQQRHQPINSVVRR